MSTGTLYTPRLELPPITLELVEAVFRGDRDEVERIAGRLTIEERRSAFLADKWGAFETLALVQFERGDFAAAYGTSERLRARQMMALLSRGSVQHAGGHKPDSALLAREQNLRRRIGELTERLELEERGADSLRGPMLAGSTSGGGVIREGLARAQSLYERLDRRSRRRIHDTQGSSHCRGHARWIG